jgi:plastocyanin
MTISRRRLLWTGGGLAALLPTLARPSLLADIVEITMGGRDNGAHVWFDPAGLLIEPGQTIRWTNRDPGNAHTATAYHPQNYDRPRRMPQNAPAWDSDFLLPEETYSLTLTQPGVYDYYCIPHEHAGMVGRIVVGAPVKGGWTEDDRTGDLPEVALRAFPSVDEIMARGVVRRS